VLFPDAREGVSQAPFIGSKRRGFVSVVLLVLLALLVAAFVGLGFVVKWLFIVAIVAALIWLIVFFTGGIRSRGV
jgi:hypothetical protein